MIQRINHEDDVLQYADWLEDNGHYAKSQKLRKRYELKRLPDNWSGKENWTRTSTRAGTRAWTRTWSRTKSRFRWTADTVTR